METNRERYTRAVNQTRPDVTALDIGAEPVLARGPLQDVEEIDGDRTLARDQRRQNRGEGHDNDDTDPETRAVVAQESLSLFGIQHRPPDSLRGRIPQLRRRIRRLAFPSAVLPEVLGGHDAYPLLQTLGESCDDRIDVAIHLARAPGLDPLDDDAVTPVRLAERHHENHRHLESQGEYRRPARVLAGRPKNGTNVDARPITPDRQRTPPPCRLEVSAASA